MPGKDIIVIGGSAGAIEPIRTILSGPPRDFPESIFVVVHTSANARTIGDGWVARAGVSRSPSRCGSSPTRRSSGVLNTRLNELDSDNKSCTN